MNAYRFRLNLQGSSFNVSTIKYVQDVHSQKINIPETNTNPNLALKITAVEVP